MFEISYFGAFSAGLLSFLTPCILPIVPFYLSYLAGISIGQVTSEEGISPNVRRRALLSTLLFSLGIITIFVGLGATATLFGQTIRAYFDILRWVAGGIIILMGLHFLGIIRIGFLQRQLKIDSGNKTDLSFFGAYVFGLAFAFGWTPCVGPVLAAILFTAAGQETATQGGLLLFVYASGMSLPFVLASFFIEPFLKLTKKFYRYMGLVEKIMGVFLILFGILIATNSMNYIAQWMLETIPWFGGLG